MMARYISPVLARWRTREKYLPGRRKRDGKHLEKVERYVTTLGKFHKKYQQSQPGVVYEEGLPTRPNTPVEGSEPPPPLPAPVALSYDDLPAPSSSKSIKPPTDKLRKLKAKVQRYLKRAQKMPVLTRSASVNRPYLTPHTPLSTHPKVLLDLAPLPSLFDKMIEVAKRGKRSTSVELESKAGGDPPALSPIVEEAEEPSSDSVEVPDVPQPSEAPAEVGGEPEPVAHQPPTTSDHMDFEDTPIVFSELTDHTPPPAPIVPPPTLAPVSLQPHEEVLPNFLPPNSFYIHPTQPTPLPPANHEPLPLPELTNSATFPHPTTYYNPPSTSANLGLHFPPLEEVPLQLAQMSEDFPQLQIPDYNTVYPQYPTFPPPAYPNALPILSASAPVQNTVQPAILPVLAQSLPTFTPIPTYPGLNSQREEPYWALPPPSAPAEASYRRPMFVPQVQQRPGPEEDFAWWLQPLARLPNWRVRELERQREMDLIAEPYLARLREVSRQKKAKGDARALAGEQKVNRAKEERSEPLKDSLREKEKKARKELKEAERQQRSEERRQTRKDAREDRRRRRSAENVPPEGQETRVSASPRRKSSGRSKPYSIPNPATRSPRRSHVMPGGFDVDTLTSGQTCVSPDAFWGSLRSAVDMGFRLWT